MVDYTQTAIDAGLSPDLAPYANRWVNIESSGNPNARTGRYSGLLQMGPDEQAKYGGNDAASGFRMYADKANWFQNQYGRQPSPTELYMTNQQGQGGFAAHMANPDAPAWQNMYSTAEGQKKGPGWAKQAIWGNVPDDLKGNYPGGVDSLTSSQFMDLWKHKVERTPLNTNLSSAYAPSGSDMSNAPGQTAIQAALKDQKAQAMTPMEQAYAAQQQPQQQNQYAYSPGYDPNAGLFDRLRQGGPGALFGAPHGVFPGADGKPGYNLGTALQKAALFAMNKPEALPAVNDDAKFVQIGTDTWGNPRYGFVHPKTGAIMPADGAGSQTTGGGGNVGGGSLIGGNDPVQAAIASGKTGEDLLASPGIPEQYKSMVRGINSGSQPYNPATLIRMPYGRPLMALLEQYEPGADLQGRQAGAKDWATKSNEITRRASQAARHGSELVDQFGDIKGSTSYPLLNSAINTVDEQTGGPAMTKARMNVTAFANEMGAAVRGNGGSDASFKEWAENFPLNGSDAQKRAAMSMGAKLFRDTMQEMEQKRARAIGPMAAKKGPLFSPEVGQGLARMEAYGNGGKSTGTTMAPGVTSIKQID